MADEQLEITPKRIKAIAYQHGLVISDDSGRKTPFDGQFLAFAKTIAACVPATPVDPTTAANTKNTMIVMLNALQVAQTSLQNMTERYEKAQSPDELWDILDGTGAVGKALDQAVALAQKELKL